MGHDEEHATAPTQAKYEEELERIRTEGDLALIKAQAEQQQLLIAEEQLQNLRRLWKEKKKQHTRSPVKPSALVTEKLNHDQSRHMVELADRLKVAASERAAELQRMKRAIDGMRLRRAEGLHKEKLLVEDMQAAKDEIQRMKEEVLALKQKEADLKDEVAQCENEFDIEKNEFRLEQQGLLSELERIIRPEKGNERISTSAKTGLTPLPSRRKRVQLLKENRLSLEQKAISFEQKKQLLDKLVEKTRIQNLGEFIRIYNEQERVKSEILSRIEAKSFINSSLSEAIAQLEEDITKLSGAGDIQTIAHAEQPLELKKRIDADQAQITQWTQESQTFAEKLRSLRKPIRELYNELFPQSRDDEIWETTINELSMLRRIGAIEERTMQRVLMRILREVETGQHSETLKRLLAYRGLQRRTQIRQEEEDKRRRGLALVPTPSVAETHHESEDDEDVVAVRSEECRQQRIMAASSLTANPSTATISSNNNSNNNNSNHNISYNSSSNNLNRRRRPSEV
ncbi:TPA: hypothetical protein N0F65_011443 [Lagenidium giganteum]|uniref:Uncharacterized protein n=1 Tax=Lagenidium giganteum TaxID=4803 RepID=A0AAV2ZDA0_9STRA|nr:TPA: hypothetical protein N0F65_011443 [Lagenidium giganteum]